MNEQAKEARRAYKREWAKKNRDKVKAAEERYWTKKAQVSPITRVPHTKDITEIPRVPPAPEN